MMRLLLLVLLAGLLSGCVWTDDNVNWAARAEAEATIHEVDEWPDSLVKASDQLRTDARTGLDLIGEATAAEQISPSVAGREYPVEALCYLDSSIYEDEAPRFVHDLSQAWFSADREDLDRLASSWAKMGYFVTPYDLEGAQTGTVVFAKSQLGTLVVGKVPGQDGEYYVTLSTRCFALDGE